MSAEQQAGADDRPAGPRRTGRSSPAGAWRGWLLSGTARAGIATGFLLTPTVRVQLGDAAVAALCVFIGGILAGVLAGHWYVARRSARRDIAADIVAVVALAPSAIVAAGIQGAEDRFGGRTAYVLAALGATMLIFAIVALVARMDDRIDFGEAAIGALGGALTFAALLGNPERYTTGDIWQALSIAWMVAALATVIFGLLPAAVRPVFPVGVYILFALAVVLMPLDLPAQETENGVESLSVLGLIVTGAIMVLIAPARSTA